MPRMGGLELLREIRRRERDLPVVFLTAFGKPATFAEAMDLGPSISSPSPFTHTPSWRSSGKLFTDHEGDEVALAGLIWRRIMVASEELGDVGRPTGR